MANDLSIESRDAHRDRQIRHPSHFFVNPEFDVETFAADIAVIRSSVPFYHTPFLFPMPRALATPEDNLICQLAGW
jgi:hypothetical protein